MLHIVVANTPWTNSLSTCSSINIIKCSWILWYPYWLTTGYSLSWNFLLLLEMALLMVWNWVRQLLSRRNAAAIWCIHLNCFRFHECFSKTTGGGDSLAFGGMMNWTHEQEGMKAQHKVGLENSSYLEGDDCLRTLVSYCGPYLESHRSVWKLTKAAKDRLCLLENVIPKSFILMR